MTDEQKTSLQIAICQTPRLPYLQAHTEARRRIRQGQQQVFCLTCQRWKWHDELCDLAMTRPGIIESGKKHGLYEGG